MTTPRPLVPRLRGGCRAALLALATAFLPLPALANGAELLAADKSAAPAPTRPLRQSTIQADNLIDFHVTTRGQILRHDVARPAAERETPHRDPLRGPGCNTLSTHSSANFTGGQFTIQAGFVQGEIAAASFSVPAGSYPIRIDYTEMVFATSGTTITTTTRYSVLIWDGVPGPGNPPAYVIQSGSEPGDPPHLVIPPGTNGVNVQVSVDPSEPGDQLILTNASGTGRFTVGYRIDLHNAQSGNGCTNPPPQSGNAFPTTDAAPCAAGGLAAPNDNWLFAIDCGSFGCSAGWTTFAALPCPSCSTGFCCRPSGDWNIRVAWSPVNCIPTGACCLPDGSCSQLTAEQCAAANGLFRGEGTGCATANCPPPATGACCFSNGGCLNRTNEQCTALGGTYQGNGTACVNNTCPTGACCLPDGSCQSATPAACAALGGTFRGVGSNCGTANCPQPLGACCLPGGGCSLETQADCGIIPGAVWHGAGSACPSACTQPTCTADWDNNAVVNTADITSFLNAWFADRAAGTTVADVTGDGTVGTADITAFLSLWFTARAEGC